MAASRRCGRHSDLVAQAANPSDPSCKRHGGAAEGASVKLARPPTRPAAPPQPLCPSPCTPLPTLFIQARDLNIPQPPRAPAAAPRNRASALAGMASTLAPTHAGHACAQKSRRPATVCRLGCTECDGPRHAHTHGPTLSPAWHVTPAHARVPPAQRCGAFHPPPRQKRPCSTAKFWRQRLTHPASPRTPAPRAGRAATPRQHTDPALPTTPAASAPACAPGSGRRCPCPACSAGTRCPSA